MQAESGAELACRARNHNFGQTIGSRGVIAHYAARSLPTSQSPAEWLENIDQLVRADIATGLLPETHAPSMLLECTSAGSLPGTPIPSTPDRTTGKDAESRT